MAERQKKPSVWGRFLLIWAALLLLLGFLGCLLLYRYLDAYEQSRPEPVMDALMAQRSAEDWLDAAEADLAFETTPYEDPRELFRSWRESLSLDGALSCRKAPNSSDAEKAVYIVRCGPVNLCRVELVPGEKALGFGLHDWVPGRISSADLSAVLRSTELEITALSGQTVLLNGLPLEDRYAVERDLPLEDLSALEARYDPPPSLTRYRVSPLYGSISVSDAEGREFFPDASSEALLRYDAVPAQRLSLSISAPEDISVQAGGVVLDASFVQSQGPDLLAGLEDRLGQNVCLTRVYGLDGLLSAPQIRAFAPDGTELEPVVEKDGRYVFLHPGDPAAEEDLRSAAEDFFSRYLSYISSAYSESRHYSLLNRTLWGTELYDYFLNSKDTMVWAIQTDTEFRDLSFDHFHRLGEDCFLCTIRYEAGVSGSTWTDAYSHEDQNLVELVFVRENGVWLAAAMKALGG